MSSSGKGSGRPRKHGGKRANSGRGMKLDNINNLEKMRPLVAGGMGVLDAAYKVLDGCGSKKANNLKELYNSIAKSLTEDNGDLSHGLDVGTLAAVWNDDGEVRRFSKKVLEAGLTTQKYKHKTEQEKKIEEIAKLLAKQICNY